MSYKFIFASILILTLCLSSCLNKSNGTLPVKVAVIYGFGGAQPVAQGKFYLLNKDFDEIAEAKGEFAVLINPFISALGEVPSGSILEEGIKEHIIASTTTDFEGSGKFENVIMGSYFLVGTTTTRSKGEYILWNLPVEIKADNQTLLLSQKNGTVMATYYKKKNEREQEKK
jgi:hypothetical protein